jgi:hypothetical protein
VRAARRLDHAVDHAAVEQQRVQRPLLEELVRAHDPLAGDEAPLRRHAEEIIEVGIGPEVLAVTRRVRAVHVHERDVELQRGHRDELLPVVVGRAHRLELGIQLQDVGAQARARGQEWQPVCRRVQAPLEHPLVELERLDRAGLARARKCGSSGIESSETKPKHAFLTWPAAHRIPRSGPPYETIVRSFKEVRRISRTTAIGLRREPQPPIPIVMPSRSSATASAREVRLSTAGNHNETRRSVNSGRCAFRRWFEQCAGICWMLGSMSAENPMIRDSMDRSPRATTRSARRFAGCAGLALFALGIVLYARTLRYGLVNWDDPGYLIENPLIRGFSLENLLAIFTSPVMGAVLPVHQLSYLLDYALWGSTRSATTCSPCC